MRAWPYYVVYVLPPCFVAGVLLGGPWVWLTPAVVFGGIPLMDLVLGHDRSDPPEGAERNPLFDAALWLWLPVQVGLIGVGIWRMGQPLSAAEAIGLTVSLGLVTGGGGINVAHELMHRASRPHRAAAEGLMASVTYTWFCVEHVLGHHRRVATRDDPASARQGESLWAFLPRSIGGGLFSAWRLEGERCARRGIAPWRLADRRLRYGLGLLGVYALVLGLGGLPGGVFFAAQSLVAVILLETVNYVEHYGLQREVGPDGRAERVQPHHSWNSTYRFTNWFLFNLQRHADHHASASRPYPALRAWPDAPQLPLGYSAMILLALVPPLWFRVMDPRVAAVRHGAVGAV